MRNHTCPNCGTVHDGKFCPNCATPAPKKKGVALPVVLAVLAVLLFGCVGGGDEPKEPAKVDPDSSVTSADTGDQQQSEPQTESQSAPQAEKPVLEQVEIYNANGVVVVANSLEDGLFGPEISLTVENTSDKNITVSSRELSVNGYMFTSSSLYADVAAGKKAKETMTLMSSEMEAAGIDTVAEVAFWLHIYDSDSFKDIDDSDLITLRTSVADTYVQEVDDSGELIYSDKDIRVVCKGLVDDSLWDGTVVFYIENNRNESVSVRAENVSVNGFMVDEGMWADLRPMTRSVDGMYLLSLEDAEVESLEDVKSIEFTLKIVDAKWKEIDETDPIELTFE